MLQGFSKYQSRWKQMIKIAEKASQQTQSRIADIDIRSHALSSVDSIPLSLNKEEFRADGIELAILELRHTDTTARTSRRPLDKKQYGIITGLLTMHRSAQ